MHEIDLKLILNNDNNNNNMHEIDLIYLWFINLALRQDYTAQVANDISALIFTINDRYVLVNGQGIPKILPRSF